MTPLDALDTTLVPDGLDRSWLALPVAIAVGLGVRFLADLPVEEARILGITLFCIVMWIGNPIPPSFTGVLGIGLIMLGFSPSLALTGFAQPVLWLIVFGLIIGEAIHQSRLTTVFERRIVRWVGTEVGAGSTARVGGETAGGGTPGAETAGTETTRAETPGDATAALRPLRIYRRLLVLLCFVGLTFALMVPSALVRVLILAPILDQIGKLFESRAAPRGLLFGPLFATFYGGVGILTGSLPNVVIVGLVESVAGVSISWTEWFVSLFPIMGLGRVVLVIGVTYLLYRPEPNSGLAVDLDAGGAGASPDLRRMGAYLLVGVVVWATDFVHGLHPVFGALLVATLLLLPGVGTVSFDVVEEVDFTIVFFVGVVFAIAAGLSRTGFTDRAASYLLDFVPTTAPLPVVLAAVFGITLALVFVLEGVAASSVLTPILVSYAAESGLPLEPIVMTEAVALGHFFFPYQSIVLVAILSHDPIEPGELIRVTTVLSLATIVLLLPLQILYL